MATIQIKIKEKGSITRKVTYHNPLKRAILTTLSFFDISQFPLSQIEIEKYLHRTTASPLDLSIMLKRLQGKGLIAQKGGFWFLQGRSKITKIRKKRLEISDQKLKRVFRYIKLLKLIPFIKSVSVCNTLAYKNAKKKSDIDLFVITETDRLWIARALSLFLFNLLGIRGKTGEVKNPENQFCFSFFLTSNNLELNKIYLQPFDPYLSYWIATLKPVFGYSYFAKLVRKNIWYKKELPNHIFEKIEKEKPTLIGFIKFLTEKLINFLGGKTIDKKLYHLQARKIKELSDFNQMGIGIVLGRQIAKTHYLDRREYFRDELDKRLKESLRFT